MTPEQRDSVRTWWPMIAAFSAGLMAFATLKADTTVQAKKVDQLEQKVEVLAEVRAEQKIILRQLERIERKLDEEEKKP